MAEYTKYKKLELPKSNEKYDVGVANKNNQVIDSELNKLDLKNQSQDSSITQTQNSLNDHKNNTSNPHNVTKEQIGLNNVDNTSDMDKPVSSEQQMAIDISIIEHNSSDISHNDIRETLLNLSTRLNTLADSDDETLDQLSEIVVYIKNNKTLIDGITTSKVNVSDIIDNLSSSATDKPISANQGMILKGLITDLTTLVETKVDKVFGKGLSTNDYTTEEKQKLSGIATGAEVNVQSDWEVTDISSNAFIKNKPVIPTLETLGAASETHTHGSMKTITYSTTEPTTVAEGEIVMVYEDGGN